MNRRTFLAGAAAGALSHSQMLTAASNVPVIDTHIHLFDISRPQGVPWPPKGSPMYHGALPSDFRKVAEPFGIVGAIEIECSPLVEDNQWVLDVAEREPLIVGMIGDLEPGKPDFSKHLDRFRKNPLFLGIRYGNLWSRDLAHPSTTDDLDREVANSAFIADLKLLAGAGLVLDTANPDPKLIHAVVRLTDQIPNLKVVLDHLPELELPADETARKACDADLRLLAKRTRVFAKISGIVRRVDGKVPMDLPFYRDRLDHLWEIFGADRLFFGSDWPNSDQWAQYPDVFRLAHEFISSKDHATVQKFYWRNSQIAYRWKPRSPAQAQLHG